MSSVVAQFGPDAGRAISKTSKREPLELLSSVVGLG
jgi:hypothetical protein